MKSGGHPHFVWTSDFRRSYRDTKVPMRCSHRTNRRAFCRTLWSSLKWAATAVSDGCAPSFFAILLHVDLAAEIDFIFIYRGGWPHLGTLLHSRYGPGLE
jgi:hypothetical protein